MYDEHELDEVIILFDDGIDDEALVVLVELLRLDDDELILEYDEIHYVIEELLRDDEVDE